MPDSAPSLLTRTQRDRVQSDFEDVASAKQRRDERKIRERVAAGIDDFELLADYPDRQFELAFEGRSEDELQTRLADVYLVVERIRALHNVDRDAMIETARERRRSMANESAKSLENVQLRTRDDWRRTFESELAAEYRASRWKRLSDALLKIGLGLVVVVSLLAVVAPDFTNGVGSLPGIVGAGMLAGGLGIVGVRAVKYDLLPAVRQFVSDPTGALRDVWNQF